MVSIDSARDVWRYRGLIFNFAARETKGQYKGSVLGSAWSLLNPLATLAIYSIVFGFFLRFPIPPAGNGTLQNFTLHLFAGLVVWNFFNSVVLGSIQALVNSGPLLRKIYFPPFAPVMGSTLSVLTQTGIEFGLLLLIFIIVGNVGWSFLLVPVMLVFLYAFSLGVGLFFAMINARFRDVGYIVAVMMNFLFYSAPIIYPISMVRERYAEYPWLQIYEYNPLTVFVESFRNATWDLTAPPLWMLVYQVVVGLGVLLAGWVFFQKRAPDVSEQL